MAKKTLAKLKPSEISQTVKWVLTGASADDVADAIKAANFEGEPAALMLAAMEQFRQAGNFEPDIVRGWCFEAARDLYRRMVESGDYAGALRAVKQIEGMVKHVRNQDDDAHEETEADASGPTSLQIAGTA